MTTAPRQRKSGQRRRAPTFPPIDPSMVYPIRRLADWGFGSRGIAALQKAGLPVFCFGKRKFFSGADLVAVLKKGGSATNHKATLGAVGANFTGRAKESL